MTQSFQDMLYLFGAGALGRTIRLDHEPNVDKIRELSLEQGIWETVYLALPPNEQAKKYKSEVLLRISQSVKRKEFTFRVLEQLSGAGIQFCMLKGAAAARLYANPDCRISADADILVNPEDENRVLAFLETKGYHIYNKTKNSHHTGANHSIGGLIEVHTSLFGKSTNELIFQNAFRPSGETMEFKFDGFCFRGQTLFDGLVYLTFHYVKHLINGGAGVRQMMDLLLYIREYKQLIDFNQYQALLKKLNFDLLINITYAIGSEYFGFDFAVDNASPQLAEKLLTDIETRGLFGRKETEQINYYSIFCQMKSEMNNSRFTLYMMKNAEKHIFLRIFPPKYVLLRTGYRYARHTILIPVAWLHRLFHIVCQLVSGKRVLKPGYTQNIDADEKINERMKLFMELGML